VAGCRLACSQNKWYSDPTDTSIGARLCVVCVWSGGFGVTRVALKRRIDAGRLMAQLASAFIYCCMPQLRLSHMCHRERGVRGVSSVVCYAVLCPLSGGLCGLLCRVMPWSGGRVLFPAISRLIRVQVRSSRVQFGTKNDAAGYTLAEPRHIRVKCGAGQSAACV